MTVQLQGTAISKSIGYIKENHFQGQSQNKPQSTIMHASRRVIIWAYLQPEDVIAKLDKGFSSHIPYSCMQSKGRSEKITI